VPESTNKFRHNLQLHSSWRALQCGQFHKCY